MEKLEDELTLEGLKLLEKEMAKFYDVTREAVYREKRNKVRLMIAELEKKNAGN